MVSCWRAPATWLSVNGIRESWLDDGFQRATVISVRLAKMRSLDEVRGMVTLVGNQEMVSEMHVELVANIQMV